MNVEPALRLSYLRIRFSLISINLGMFIFVIGAKPNWFGWDRSPVVGFAQIVVFLVGLAMICAEDMLGFLPYGGMSSAASLQILDCAWSAQAM